MFNRQSKRIAGEFSNPRIIQIHFHTLRHCGPSIEYHRTKGIFHVKNFLGHKSVKNTEIYVNIERTLFEPSGDEFAVRVTEKPEDIEALFEVGFKCLCPKDSLFLRKRK